MMKYCLDISAVPYGTGVSRYTGNLACSLKQQLGEELSFFGTSLRQFGKLLPYGGKLYPLPPSLTTKLFHDWNVPIETLIGEADVFHSWDWYLPASRKTKTVITIHDLALFKYPDIAHPEIKRHHEEVMRRIKQLKPQIITVSQATKTDLIEMFDVDPYDVTVVYEALPEELKISGKLPARKRPYFLMVGTLEPRKNYPRQIEAWRKYKDDYDLVIVGKEGWETIEPELGITRINYASPEILAGLYQQASLLLYCSLAEGFGLPILEADYHHCPVVTSNCSSMKEIATAHSAYPTQVHSSNTP